LYFYLAGKKYLREVPLYLYLHLYLYRRLYLYLYLNPSRVSIYLSGWRLARVRSVLAASVELEPTWTGAVSVCPRSAGFSMWKGPLFG